MTESLSEPMRAKQDIRYQDAIWSKETTRKLSAFRLAGGRLEFGQAIGAAAYFFRCRLVQPGPPAYLTNAELNLLEELTSAKAKSTSSS